MTLNTPIRDVLAYMFSPPENFRSVPSESIGSSRNVLMPSDSDPSTFGQLRARSPYTEWGELAVRLEDEKFRAEYVYFFDK